MADKIWEVNKDSTNLKHLPTGMLFWFEDCDVVNITHIPDSVKTYELPSLIDQAIREYNAQDVKNHVISKKQPTKTILSLKKVQR